MPPNDFGRKLVVEECRKVAISDFLRTYRRKEKESFLASEIEAGGQRIVLTTSRTGFGGLRYWFQCPVCQRRTGVLYQHPLTPKVGCRTCLDLDYRKRRYKGMPEEGLAR